MNDVKKDLIRDVTTIFAGLTPQKQERAIGIMQGMMMAEQERVHAAEREEKRGASA